VKEELGDASSLFEKVFNIHHEGNYVDELLQKRTRKNILYLKKPIGELASELGMNPKELRKKLEEARKALLDAREKRVPPSKDDKILTDWNGLMIVALATAAQAFNEPAYREAAKRSAKFILEHLQTREGRLLHRFREGEAAQPGNFDDYAFFIWGLIELYEATFEHRFLSEAIRLQDVSIEHFWDADNGGFFFTADDAEKILIRHKEAQDGALPSGNSVALLNMLRLARMTGNEDYTLKAERLVKTFSPQVMQSPVYNTMFLTSLDFLFGPSYEIVLVGDLDSEETRGMLNSITTKFLPNKIILFKTIGDSKLEKIAGYTSSMKTIENKTTAYICKNFACKAPTTETCEVEKTLTRE